MTFSHSFRVKPDDIDEQGHVNNVAYVRWIQDVAVAHWLSAAGEDVRQRFTWIVLRHEVDYKKQAFEDDEVTAVTWVGEPTKVTWERLTEIHRDGEILVQARSVWCMIDRATQKPSRITEEIRCLLV